MDNDFYPLLKASELGEGQTRAVTLCERSLLVCHAGGEYYVVENRCPHQGSALEGGRIRRGTIICPVHGMGFELKTGAPKGQLTNVPLRTFPVRIVDGMLEVSLAADTIKRV